MPRSLEEWSGGPDLSKRQDSVVIEGASSTIAPSSVAAVFSSLPSVNPISSSRSPSPAAISTFFVPAPIAPSSSSGLGFPLPPGITPQNLPKSITPQVLAAIQALNFTPNAIGAGYLCYADPYAPVGYVLDPTAGHICQPGFFCPNIEPTDKQNLTLPVICPPVTECSVLRTYGSTCPPQGLFEPVVCKIGHYCPDQLTQIPCPKGFFCPTGSMKPYPCAWLSSCPAGSVAQMQYGPVIIAFIIDMFIFAFVLFRKRAIAVKKAKELLQAKKERASMAAAAAGVGSPLEGPASLDRKPSITTAPRNAYYTQASLTSPVGSTLSRPTSIFSWMGVSSPILRPSGRAGLGYFNAGSPAISVSRSGSVKSTKGGDKGGDNVSLGRFLTSGSSTNAKAFGAGTASSGSPLGIVSSDTSPPNSEGLLSPLSVPISEISRRPSNALVPSLLQSATAAIRSSTSAPIGRSSTSSSTSPLSMPSRPAMMNSVDLEANHAVAIKFPVVSQNNGSMDPSNPQPHTSTHNQQTLQHQQHLDGYSYPTDEEVPLEPASPTSPQLAPPRPWFGKRTWSGVSWTEAIERNGGRRWTNGRAPISPNGVLVSATDGQSTSSGSSSSGSQPAGFKTPPTPVASGVLDLQHRHRRNPLAGATSPPAKDQGTFRSFFSWWTGSRNVPQQPDPSRRLDMVEVSATGKYRRTALRSAAFSDADGSNVVSGGAAVQQVTDDLSVNANATVVEVEEEPAASGEFLVVGAPNDEDGANADTVGLVMTHNASSWASIHTYGSAPAMQISATEVARLRSAGMFIPTSDESSMNSLFVREQDVSQTLPHPRNVCSETDRLHRSHSLPATINTDAYRETNGNGSPALSHRRRRTRPADQSRSMTLVTFENTSEDALLTGNGAAADSTMVGPHMPSTDPLLAQRRHSLRHLPPPIQIAKMPRTPNSMGFSQEVQDIVSNVFTEMDMSRLISSWQKGLRVAPGIRMEFDFKNLCVRLPSGREVLKSVSGSLKSGRMTAIMGPSGSGKTTLMNVLLGKMKNTSGEIRINNRPSDPSVYRKVIGYVPQEDTMLRELTVREVILHSGRVRLPPNWTEAEVEEHIDNVIGILGVQKPTPFFSLGYVSDNVIGDERDRGISGGQRKRVNVGMELAAVPLALLLDEPTSGLDATSALLLISLLSSITRFAGLTTVAILHQPRPEVFHLFDDVIMLAPSGQVAYSGPVNSVRTYFESVGFEMSSISNIADQAMDILCGASILKKKPDGIGTLGTSLSSWEIAKIWERRSRKLNRKRSKHGHGGATTVASGALPNGSALGVSNSKEPNAAPTNPTGMPPAAGSTISMVATLGDSDQIETVPGGCGSDGEQPSNAQPAAVVPVDACCEAAALNEAQTSEEAEKLFYSSIAGLLKDRGASFIQQFLYCHQRSLVQQSRKLGALSLEIFVAMFAGFLMGISLQGIDELYRGVYRGPYVSLSPANSDWVGLYGLLIGIAVAMAGAPAGVKVFGEEKTVYWREASSGHSRGAYFLGKSIATIYRFIVSSLHFSAIYYFFARPIITFSAQYLTILLSFWGIYGLSCIVSMIVRRENAPLLAVVFGLFAAVFCGFGPSLRQAKQWKILWLWELSYNKWAAEAQYASTLSYYTHVYDTERSAAFFGYSLNQINLDYSMILVIGVGLRMIGFALLVMLNRDKQK
ncbi:hypothetical protein HDU67_004669 [Dinochytrium kinnereticum]|nr:hypothetical protein HDU67_004669 [Dinochytrium kinnereticum]